MLHIVVKDVQIIMLLIARTHQVKKKNLIFPNQIMVVM